MKKYLALAVIAVIAIGSILVFFFYRMGTNDAKALADFPAAYRNYTQAIADYSQAVLATPSGGALPSAGVEQKANQAQVALQTQASVRLSSLTKNDGDLMQVSLEIAKLTGQELALLKTYQGAITSQSGDLNQLEKQYHELASRRQADFARYLELAGINH